MRTPINEVATHRNPHLDDLVAITLLVTFGEQKYQFPNGGPKVVFEETDTSPNTLQVGMGGGDLDEHKPEGRLAGQCATSLTAQALNLAEIPALWTLLSEVQRADTQPGQTHFELGEALKTLFGYGEGFTPQMALEIVRRVVEGFIHLDGEPIPEPVHPQAFIGPTLFLSEGTSVVNTLVMPKGAGIQELAAMWLLVNRNNGRIIFPKGEIDLVEIGPEELERLEQLQVMEDAVFIGFVGGHFGTGGSYPTFREAMDFFGVRKDPELHVLQKEATRWETQAAKPLELPSLIALLSAGGMSLEEIYTLLVDPMFAAQATSSHEFMVKCPPQFARNGTMVNVGEMQIAFVHSDLHGMNRWLRAVMKVDVVVQRSTNRNVAIFTETACRAVVYDIARAILLAEGGDADARAELEEMILHGRDRTMPAPADLWYLFGAAGQILNGSTTHEVLPTHLSNQDLQVLVVEAVNAYAWRKAQGEAGAAAKAEETAD